MKLLKIFNARIVSDGNVIDNGTLVAKDGLIDYCGTGNREIPDGNAVIDAGGRWLSPGFIDMHTHGAGGSDFMDGTVDAFLTAARMHAIHGTTLLYPTTLTSSNDLLFETFRLYEDASALDIDGAAFGGLHLEGPYFSPMQGGAQDPRYLRNPEPDEYMEVLSRSGSIVRWSLAPELPGALEFGKLLSSRGILPAMAHTNATFEEADAAFKCGFTHMTHFFSCMSTVTRRNAYRYAGVIEYGYFNDDVTVEIICDGIHVPKSLLKLIYKIKGPDMLALVTDSMRAAGMPSGKSVLGSLKDGQEVIVEDGVAKLPDRSAFAGSVATTDRLVRTAVTLGEIPMPQAVRMATATPARIMGVSDRKGSLRPGFDADMVMFDDNVDIFATVRGGKVIYKR
jgi:N-acetylglucosamine-6-phosphate deacetylase